MFELDRIKLPLYLCQMLNTYEPGTFKIKYKYGFNDMYNKYGEKFGASIWIPLQRDDYAFSEIMTVLLRTNQMDKDSMGMMTKNAVQLIGTLKMDL